MRVLVHAGCFAKQEDDAYALAPWSRLLVSSEHTAAAPFVVGMLHPLIVQSWHSLGAWFHGRAPTPFAAAHGKGIFETAREQPGFVAVFNEAMASDSRLVGQVLVKKHAGVFEGARSMVDVGGCTGTLAAIVAEAFPHLKCTVLDLPHVVAAAAAAGTPNNLDFVGGNMFDHIPSADIMLLKSRTKAATVLCSRR
ncbi:o-methyltransferase [Musa troglodytarum]|nr:o-methyltransferase [Musa troglodytarum]